MSEHMSDNAPCVHKITCLTYIIYCFCHDFNMQMKRCGGFCNFRMQYLPVRMESSHFVNISFAA